MGDATSARGFAKSIPRPSIPRRRSSRMKVLSPQPKSTTNRGIQPITVV
jgi:hypothetical protein